MVTPMKPGQKPDVEGQRRGHDHHRQQIPPLAIGPQRMLTRGLAVRRDRQWRRQRDIPDQSTDAGEEEEEDEQAHPNHDLSIAPQVPQHDEGDGEWDPTLSPGQF